MAVPGHPPCRLTRAQRRTLRHLDDALSQDIRLRELAAAVQPRPGGAAAAALLVAAVVPLLGLLAWCAVTAPLVGAAVAVLAGIAVLAAVAWMDERPDRGGSPGSPYWWW